MLSLFDSSLRKLGVLALAALVALPLLLTGCVTTQVSRDFPEQARISYRGGEIDPAVWEVARAAEPDALPYRGYTLSWILPLTLRQHSIIFPESDRGETRSLAYNGLGFPLFLLPLRFQLSESVYLNGETEPSETQWTTWTPLWTANNAENWDPETGRVRTRGIPLFFGRMDVERESHSMGLWHTLWSLGPAYAKYRGENLAPPQPEADPGELRVTAGMPLALGGILGALLWFDLELRVEDGPNRGSLSTHGPLGGLLGYAAARSRAMAVETDPETEVERRYIEHRSNKVLLGGLLWLDLIAKEEGNRASHFEARGPLWSAFGWGKRGGRNAVRVFWIPVVLPGQGGSE